MQLEALVANPPEGEPALSTGAYVTGNHRASKATRKAK
jgi:hypothetical protein